MNNKKLKKLQSPQQKQLKKPEKNKLKNSRKTLKFLLSTRTLKAVKNPRATVK